MKIENLNKLLEFIDFNFVAIKEIYSSGQRIVYEAKNKIETDNKNYVIKISRQWDSTNVARLQREISILNDLDSDYFPKIFAHGFYSKELLLDYIDNIDINKDLMVKNDVLYDLTPFYYSVEEFINHQKWVNIKSELKNEKTLIDILIEIFTALNILWTNKIVHRDLKPDNILLIRNKDNKLIPIIIDLGAAKSFRDGTINITQSYMSAPHTLLFASPEQLFDKKDEINYKVDQFSVGVTIYYALTDKFPFGDIREIGTDVFFDNMLNNRAYNIKNFINDLSDEFVSFLNKLLEVQQFKRYRNGEKIIEDLKMIRSKL